MASNTRAHIYWFVADEVAEVERLVALGATVLAEHDDEGGYRTAVLGDPELNEFCVVQR